MQTHEQTQYFGRDLEAMAFAVNYHRWILAELKPYLGRRVVEVGAGVGNFTELLSAHVDTLLAYEPAANMYPLLAQKFAGNARVQTVQGFFGQAAQAAEKAFDAVVYVNVLEHVQDDHAELLRMRDALKIGGHALVFVPALPCLYSELDKAIGHFRRYRKSVLQKLAIRAGFEIVKINYFDIAGILPWYLNFVLLKRPITPGGVACYDRYVVPLMRRIEQRLAPPIGKNLLLIARKV